MGAVTWIEVLGKHQEVVSRHRYVGDRLRIGRSYDNDLVLDDPHVAPFHLICERPAAQPSDGGQAAAALIRLTDQGTLNGTWRQDGAQNKGRERRIDEQPIDGQTVVRVGRTYLRIRDQGFVVEPERVLSPDELKLRWTAAIATLIVFLLLEALYQWMRLIETPKLTTFLSPMTMFLGSVVSWTTAWAVISRVFSGIARFDRHLLIASMGLLLTSAVDEALSILSFATVQAWPPYTVEALFLIAGALTVFFHVRVVSPSRLRAKAAAIAVVTLGIGLVQYAVSSEEHSTYGDATAIGLKPAVLQVRSARSVDQVLQQIDAMQPALDKLRSQEPGADDLDDEE